MRYPARLAHLATRAIVVAKLAPTFADAHQLDHDEAASRLGSALSGPLLDDLLAAAWQALLGGTKKLDEEGLLEKVAKSLRDRPLRPGRSRTGDARPERVPPARRPRGWHGERRGRQGDGDRRREGPGPGGARGRRTAPRARADALTPPGAAPGPMCARRMNPLRRAYAEWRRFW